MPTLDDILDQTAEFDFIKQALFVLCLLSPTFAPTYMGIFFLGFTLEHHCLSPSMAELSQQCGWSLEEQLNHTVPKWGSRIRRTSRERSISSTSPPFNLMCEDSWKLDLFQSFVNAGFFVGSISIGYIADRQVACRQVFGHKLCLWVTVLVSLALGILMAFTPSYTTLIFHLIQELDSKGAWLTGYVLIAEFVSSNHRRAAGITYQIAFSLGLILTALAALPFWRWPQLVVTLPNFFFLLYYWCLPEWPRWLIAQKQNDKAMEVIKHISKGKQKLPLSFQNLRFEDEDGEKLKPSFLDLVRTPQIRKHMLVLMHSWFTSFTIYQVIMHMETATGNMYLHFLSSALIKFPVTFIFMLTLDHIGHRCPWAAASMLAGGTCLITALVPDTLYWLKTTTACLGRMGITMCYEISCLINPELYPTFLRNLGVLICLSMCNLGGIIMPFLVYRLAELWHELPLVIFGKTAVRQNLLHTLHGNQTGREGVENGFTDHLKSIDLVFGHCLGSMYSHSALRGVC
ncbi:LOW QUALITY PROTEIN: solute carrier family 22 member 2-like [Morus bassanus]